MAGKDVAASKQQATTAAAKPNKSVPRRLWRVVRAVLYMLRRGALPTGRNKLAADLNLLRRRAGSGNGNGKPSEVADFSFSYGSGHYDAADIAKVFEMLNDHDGGGHVFDDNDALAVVETPSPVMSAAFGRARRLRVTDSPFAAAGGEQQQVVDTDRKAGEFIRRFYEQLRAQQSVAATPDHSYGYAAAAAAGHSPRPVAAGTA